MVPSVELILRRNGPLLSSSIIRIYKEMYNQSDVAARKRVSRAGDPVRRLAGINFPKNQKFLYLKDQFAKQSFTTNLIKELVQANSVFGIAAKGISSRGGYITKNQFPIICGTPEKRKKQIPPEQVLEGLIKVGLVIKYEAPNGEEYVALRGIENIDVSYAENANVVRKIIIDALVDWIRKTGFGSYHKVKSSNTSSDLPDFGSYKWDVTAPSSLYPISTISSGGYKSGFVIADISFGQQLEGEEVLYFIKKYDGLRALSKTRPFMAIMLAESYTTEAFSRLKEKGILVVTPKILFGDEISKALQTLLDTLNRAAEIAASNPEKIVSLINSLSKIQGAVGNLRGALFELVAGHMIKEEDGGYIEIGKKVKSPENKQAEIDILKIKGRKAFIYECKAKIPGSLVGPEVVETWFSEKVPIIEKWLKNDDFHKVQEMIFSVWTTSDFSPEAIEYLEKKKKNTKKYKVEWKGQDEIKNLASKQSNSAMLDTLNEHFFKHPLSPRGET